MKVHNSKPQCAGERGSYSNPRKTRRVTARERRGLEMIQGCRTAEPKREGRWAR